LYDHASESAFVDPFEATGQIGYERDCLLEPHQLREHGYGHLAEQLVAARRLGLDAGAWVVFGIGAPALARCCKRFGVTRVVLPAKADQLLVGRVSCGQLSGVLLVTRGRRRRRRGTTWRRRRPVRCRGR
jgi:hypothetical protein